MELSVTLVNASANVVKVSITDDIAISLADYSYIISVTVNNDANNMLVSRLEEKDFLLNNSVSGKIIYEYYEQLTYNAAVYQYEIIRINNTDSTDIHSNIVTVLAKPQPVKNLAINNSMATYNEEFELPERIFLEWDAYEVGPNAGNLLGFQIYYSLSQHNAFDWSTPVKLKGVSTGNNLSSVTTIPITETFIDVEVPQLIAIDEPKDIRFTIVAVTDSIQSEESNEAVIQTRNFIGRNFTPGIPLTLMFGNADDANQQLLESGRVISPGVSIYFPESAYDDATTIYFEKFDVTDTVIGWSEVYHYFVNVGNLKGTAEIAIYMPHSSILTYDVRIKTEHSTLHSIPCTYNTSDYTVRFNIKETCEFMLVTREEITTTPATTFKRATKRIIDRLPSWSRIKRSPSKSNGAYFLEVFGMSFEDFYDLMDYIQDQMYISTADIYQVGCVYKIYLAEPLEEEDSIRLIRDEDLGEYYDIKQVTTLEDFYTTSYKKIDTPEIYYDRLYFLDAENNVIYLKGVESTNFTVEIYRGDNPTPYSILENPALHLHKVWNFFDELGLLVDLVRYDWETNQSFKARILDVFKNPSGASRDELMNGIARQLCFRKSIIWHNPSEDLFISDSMIIYNKIKINGEYVPEDDIYFTTEQDVVIKAMPELDPETEVSYVCSLEMHTLHNEEDELFNKVLYDLDGKATQSLKYYKEKIDEVSPMKWGSFHWNVGYWDPISPDGKGNSFIPSIYDATCIGFKDAQENEAEGN